MKKKIYIDPTDFISASIENGNIVAAYLEPLELHDEQYIYRDVVLQAIEDALRVDIRPGYSIEDCALDILDRKLKDD